MSVKIEWQIFTAEIRSDYTWKSSSPALEELLNVIASPEKVKEPTQDVEESMALLAIKEMPYQNNRGHLVNTGTKTFPGPVC